MAVSNPIPVRRVETATGEKAWLEVEPKDAHAWLVEWGAHGKSWFHAIVDSEKEAEEMIRKCSFIG